MQLANSKVLKTDVVNLGRNVGRMLLPVTAAIYQNGVEKPASQHWTFEMAISEGLDTDQDGAEDARPRRASCARKRSHTDNFLYYDD